MKYIITTAVIGALWAMPQAHAADPFANLEPVAREDLAGATGRAGLDVEAANQALLRDNSVGPQSVTGSNSIIGSLNANAGITTVFQNTGNNTVLQSATSVIVNMR